MLSEVKSAALSLRRLSARPSPHCWLVVVEPVDLREDEEHGKQAGQRKKGGEQRRMGLVRLAMGMRSPKAATSPLGWGSSPSRSRLGMAPFSARYRSVAIATCASGPHPASVFRD